MRIRATIIDTHHHRLARALVGDPELGAEGQGLMRGGQSVGVEGLAISGALAVKARAIPGGRATLEGLCYGRRDTREREAKNSSSDGKGAWSLQHSPFPPFVAEHN